MFVLARMVDSVRIEPFNFQKDGKIEKTLEKTLNRKFANKVVLNVGLCICFYDFEKIGDSLIIPGDGSSHTKVHFRFIVFRPFMEEVLTGRIKSCDETGIYLTLGFFDDIFVPSTKLQDPSVFKDNAWAWEYQTDEEGNENGTHSLFMERGSEVRFRVVEESFDDIHPNTGSRPTEVHNVENPQQEKKCPYFITAGMSEPGLGCLSWWNSQEEEGGAAGEDQEDEEMGDEGEEETG